MVLLTQKSLRTTASEILLQEIPGEVSLSYLVSGCPLGCKGCHSQDSWSGHRGDLLTTERISNDCQKYQGLVSCVLFMGGEWQPTQLQRLLAACKQQHLQTALYTGLDYCPPELRTTLDYVKIGRWQQESGGLTNPLTNQRLYDLNRQLCLNPLLWPTPGQAYPAVPE